MSTKREEFMDNLKEKVMIALLMPIVVLVAPIIIVWEGGRILIELIGRAMHKIKERIRRWIL
jgi:hypothetical protein